MRRLLATSAAAALGLLLAASPSQAIVGGQDASPGEYPSVALISFGVFQCTGTLISPRVVLTAGHCSSVDAGIVGTPVTWPAPLIDVRVGGHARGGGERVPVSSVVAHPNYLATMGYDISLLRLSRDSSRSPVKVAGPSEGGAWVPGTPATIAGWGVTSEGGDAPDVLQEAVVPITTDAYCGSAYDDFDVRTMICAGYPEGGVDTCQGDSGGPMFGRTAGGIPRVVGSTSFGEGCARAGRPGVYARVAGDTLRNWIAGHAPAGVANDSTATRAKPKRSRTRSERSRRAARRN